LVRWLGISDGNMAEGSFRADCNVSLRRPGQPFGTRCELKNLNSFRFIEQAINVEIERQMEILEWGGEIDQETRLFDPNKMETRSMRSKEEANDYRYFPDPDLLPVIIPDEQIEAIKATMPELPAARRARFIADFGVTEYDAHVLTLSREMADFYEAVVAAAGGAKQGKIAANWVMGEFSGALNKAGLELT
ncbi:Asp-tRNA(Asn)/Glu-tRNA(Gln) amidotransferase GatCAB subunit B, partial [Enterobacteriaceae bacterium TzEc077]